MVNEEKKVEFFALSTCGWCRKTKEWLDEHGVKYQLTYLDLAQGEEREAVKQRVSQFVSRLAFPVLVVDDGAHVIQGYNPEEFEKCLK